MSIITTSLTIQPSTSVPCYSGKIVDGDSDTRALYLTLLPEHEWGTTESPFGAPFAVVFDRALEPAEIAEVRKVVGGMRFPIATPPQTWLLPLTEWFEPPPAGV